MPYCEQRLYAQVWRRRCARPLDLTDRKWAGLLTRGGHSVLPSGLVVAEGEQHGLDGADEDAGQTSVEDDVEHNDFDCGGEVEKQEQLR